MELICSRFSIASIITQKYVPYAGCIRITGGITQGSIILARGVVSESETSVSNIIVTRVEIKRPVSIGGVKVSRGVGIKRQVSISIISSTCGIGIKRTVSNSNIIAP